jgi:hypothetical protein
MEENKKKEDENKTAEGMSHNEEELARVRGKLENILDSSRTLVRKSINWHMCDLALTIGYALGMFVSTFLVVTYDKITETRDLFIWLVFCACVAVAFTFVDRYCLAKRNFYLEASLAEIDRRQQLVESMERLTRLINTDKPPAS